MVPNGGKPKDGSPDRTVPKKKLSTIIINMYIWHELKKYTDTQYDIPNLKNVFLRHYIHRKGWNTVSNFILVSGKANCYIQLLVLLKALLYISKNKRKWEKVRIQIKRRKIIKKKRWGQKYLQESICLMIQYEKSAYWKSKHRFDAKRTRLLKTETILVSLGICFSNLN
jgi:hypothetical protein